MPFKNTKTPGVLALALASYPGFELTNVLNGPRILTSVDAEKAGRVHL
jgi:hypothetical protein